MEAFKRNLEKAAKKVTDNERVKSVAGKVKKKAMVVVESDQARYIGERVVVAKKECFDPLAKKVASEAKKIVRGNKNSDDKPLHAVEVDRCGSGDVPTITSWTHGRITSNLSVYGKGTPIPPVADRDSLDNNNKGNVSGVSFGVSSSIPLVAQGADDASDDAVAWDEDFNNSSTNRSTTSNSNNKTVKLPILLFPGIASSGLYVKESGLHKKYKGRRLWMNAGFLAASAVDNTLLNKNEVHNNSHNVYQSYVGDANNDGEFVCEEKDEATEGFAKIEDVLEIRSAWLYHISLDKDMVNERTGNCVRTYDGIKACEWLVDDPIGKTQAGVWADAIRFLENSMGYIRGENLDAAPYDWRLPPGATETRDGYLSRTMKKVEDMYETNGQLPVVLCCHSMGCKMGHYFLNYCLKEKGREWIDHHIHSYMPIGAPHGGGHLTVKLGATGAGLVGLVDGFMLSQDEGLIMYRSWGSGPWLMPRAIPRGVLPACIVRREGELGIKITSQIEVGSLFAGRDKLPRKLRLTFEFRDKIRASTQFAPLKVDATTTPASILLSFDETFYLAVPYLQEDDLGKLVFYLEEPSGRLYRSHGNEIRQQFREHTQWARSFKKLLTTVYRNVAKKCAPALRVAVCTWPLPLKASAFSKTPSKIDGLPVIDSIVPFCKCNGGIDAKNVLTRSNTNDFVRDDGDQTICFLSIRLSYTPPPDISKKPTCTAQIAMVPDDTPSPPVVSRRRTYNTVSHDKVVYDNWNGNDLFEQDGFVGKMFDLYKEYYDSDTLGPNTRSALDAPPVNRVRSIYGINVPTEISAVYRKQPVVTVGDNIADRRFMLDESATFPPIEDIRDLKVKSIVSGHVIRDGIISETSKTLQHVPGFAGRRRCCGDGTVPYWSLVHCLNWKDSIPEVTVDELEGAVHRSILSDERFFALLMRYCVVDDPRKRHGYEEQLMVRSSR